MSRLVSTAVELLRRADATRAGPLSSLGLTELAALLGVSRSTLLRRIGSRRELDAVLLELGARSVLRPPVADRVVDAAAALISDRGVAAVTLDDVAARARCSVQSIHVQVGGRDAVLTETFARHSPVTGISRALEDPPGGLCESARHVYLAMVDAVLGMPVVRALLTEALARPDSGLARFVRSGCVRSLSLSLARWLARHRLTGGIRPTMGLRQVIVLFVGPVAVQALTEAVAVESRDPVVRGRVATELADSFCRAVRPDPTG
ncbi:AcrR family transcriptional regulator [Actinoalloteichus hoggarensis]|nr:TetR family transcriptional regulator [Actinoalloteichus hoggarensis]MBB5921134.1 AcrR family transcriptional regulator [Actinoalloteichus hoggarensis]